MTRTLITGGAGFIGSKLAAKLCALNHDILVIDDLSAGSGRNLLPRNNLTFIKGDITNKVMLTREFNKFKPEIVIHLAAKHFIPYCNTYPLRTLKVNIMGTRNLLDCSRVEKPDIFIFASTAAVYTLGDDINAEDSSVNPIDIYGITKLAGEEFSKLFYQETDVPTIVTRFFNVYGPNDPNPHVITEIIRQIKSRNQKLKLGNLLPKRDFIHVNDVVNVIAALLEKNKSGFNIFNVGSGKEHSIAEIVTFCSKIIGKKIETIQMQKRMRENERMHLLADIGKIKETTGWSPKIELKEGLADLLTNASLNDV